ncbi:hypothetical protein PpBr36_08392 [Pyricularia pennisetigena]|uniref:hypothetical protein n=1 Tax=Pyricularia pennisetigena TaxID=1578925 RepID=UPI00115385A4|nr:hypothetical protein PpBr36_08392 [Pyricularia pennisetigena]TLS24348.1 hypothetical protein PpBr36_08392 [Pyricularia pennisetigena]
MNQKIPPPKRKRNHGLDRLASPTAEPCIVLVTSPWIAASCPSVTAGQVWYLPSGSKGGMSRRYGRSWALSDLHRPDRACMRWRMRASLRLDRIHARFWSLTHLASTSREWPLVMSGAVLRSSMKKRAGAAYSCVATTSCVLGSRSMVRGIAELEVEEDVSRVDAPDVVDLWLLAFAFAFAFAFVVAVAGAGAVSSLVVTVHVEQVVDHVAQFRVGEDVHVGHPPHGCRELPVPLFSGTGSRRVRSWTGARPCELGKVVGGFGVGRDEGLRDPRQGFEVLLDGGLVPIIHRSVGEECGGDVRENTTRCSGPGASAGDGRCDLWVEADAKAIPEQIRQLAAKQPRHGPPDIQLACRDYRARPEEGFLVRGCPLVQAQVPLEICAPKPPFEDVGGVAMLRTR